MDVEEIRQFCLGLKASTEDIKWENNLVFSVGNKMYCLISLDEVPVHCSIKVDEEVFGELTSQPMFMQAPYLAKKKWVTITDLSAVGKNEVRRLIRRSWELVLSGLPLKTKRELGLQDHQR